MERKNKKDIYIKDEGDDFSTVIMQTEDAVEKFRKSVMEDAFEKTEVTVDSNIVKMDVENKYLYRILAWATSHNLSVESEVSIILPEKVN